MKAYAKEFLPGGILIILMLIMSNHFYETLPDQVATHFNLRGEPDGWMARETFVWFMPGLMAAIMIAVSLLIRLSPRIFAMTHGRGILGQVYLAIGALLAGLHIGLLMDPTGGTAFQASMPFFIGIMMVIVGNLMGKTERNFFIGVRVPWTLASDNNWSATHRFTGRFWVIAGLVLLGATFVTSSPVALIVAALIIPSVSGVLYSFCYYWFKERGLEEA